MSTGYAILGETERLLLRAPQVRDLEQIAALWSDPAVTKHIGGPRDPASVLEFFREYTAEPESSAEEEGERWWSIIVRTSGALVGLCSLLDKEIEGQMETELGYFLLPAYWGRGYATEAARLVARHAFSDLQLESLVAIIHPQNAGSISVVRKLGMQFEREILRPSGAIKLVYRLDRRV